MRIRSASAPTYFLRAMAVDPPTSRKTARLAVAYHSMHMSRGCATFVPGCHKQIDAWLVQSNNGGRTWNAPQRLNRQSMQ